MAQFNSLLVTGNSRFLNPINGNAKNGVYQVIGTQTAATGAWTGSIPVPALYDGLTIMYYLPYAGSGNATLNLTLSDGTTTGAVNCYYRKTERLTTHFPSGSNIVLTYYSAGSIKYDGTATSDNRWIANANYLDGNDQAYNDRIIYVRATAGSNKVFPYTLVMRLPDGRWESIVTSASTGTGKARNTHGFLFGQLDWMNYNETYNENALITEYRLWSRYTNLVDYRYSFNLTSSAGFTANKPVYLVGSISSDGLFYLDATWWTQTLPSSADGKIYLYIGDAYDWYRASFYGTGNFRAYAYTNGHVREYNQDAATVGGHTVAKDVPSNAVFTDNNTTYTFANGTNGFTVTPSGGSAQTVTVTPSITNNVTGSGTSGYIAKFNGGNTITNGPALGSSTTTFLRNDGQWATPATGSDVNVTQTATSTSANYEVLFSATADNTTRTEGARKNNNLTFNPSTGNLQATQLNGVNIGSSPKFTDNNTTYTFANGTNGFTVTPSGGSAQTVTVTPSITNNVTGSGTSGYLTKFNGANTITNGPALGSSTVTYLRNDGQWATPTDTNNAVTQTATDVGNGPYEILFSGTDDNTTRTEGVRKSSALKFCSYSSGPELTMDDVNNDGGSTALTIVAGYPALYMWGPNGGSPIISLNADKGKITCNSMSVTDISDQYTITRTSGNWYPVSLEAWRTGNVVQMRIIFRGNGSAVASGADGLVGTISDGPLPTIAAAQLVGYADARPLNGTIESTGTYRIRNTTTTQVTWNTNSRVAVGATFICQ